MKIYNKVVIDMSTLEAKSGVACEARIIGEDSYMYDGPVAGCKGGSASYPAPTEQEIGIQQAQLDLLTQQQADTDAMRPFLLESMGLIEGDDGALREMTTEERTAGMTEMERGQYDLTMQAQERMAQAYAGELPISPAMEESLAKQKQQMTEALSQRLGPNWQTTTSGQQAMASFDEGAEGLREQARQGVISGESGMLQGNLDYLGDTSALQTTAYAGMPGASQGLLAGYGGLAGQMSQQRAQQAQYGMMAHQASQQRRASSSAGFGAAAGTAMQIGMMFSDSRLKENIVTIDNAVNKVNKLRGVEFDWNIKSGLPPGQHDVGVIAQELEEVIPEAVEVIDGYKAVAYHKIIPLLIENIKILHNEINILKEV